MSKFQISDIPIARSSDTPFLQLKEVIGAEGYDTLDIIASEIRFPSIQCLGCQHVCRQASGAVWRIVAKPTKTHTIVLGKGPAHTLEGTNQDTRYSVFCTLGTGVPPVSEGFSLSLQGDAQMIPSGGIPFSNNPNMCPFNSFKRI